MIYKYSVSEQILEFKAPAQTSRNIFTQKKHWILKLQDINNPEIIGIGEAAPIEFLSPDYNINLSKIITFFIERLNKGEHFDELDFSGYPSVKFAIESSLIDLKNGGKQIYYNSDYINGKAIPINGLVWMNNVEQMLSEAIQKVEEGFNCIKIKIGNLDFDSECRMLETFRSTQQGKNCILRLDANGALMPDEALSMIKDLAKFNIHSIEQPIMPGRHDEMAKICKESKIKIALDEELIGANTTKEIEFLLSEIKPHFIVLKPTLLGGVANSLNWIKTAHKYGIDWWITSALESNIGLNIIAQWTGTLGVKLHQGLGTGKLFKNNFSEKSSIADGQLYYIG